MGSYLVAGGPGSSIERARQELGGEPRTSLAEGLARTIDGYRTQTGQAEQTEQTESTP